MCPTCLISPEGKYYIQVLKCRVQPFSKHNLVSIRTQKACLAQTLVTH